MEVDPFLEPPSWSPVGVDRDTGELRVTRALSLEASPLRLVVGAADGGSPQRYALANITIYIRNMSEPLHVSVSNSTESSLEVCWSPPAHGRPQGYVLTYTPTTAHKTYEKGSLNLTLEELQSRVVVPGADEGAANTTSQGASKEAGDALEIYRYCAVVGGLAGWTEYIVSVRAWAEGQVSMAASPLMATTRSDYCAVGVCGEGTCTLQQAAPGYACECHPGYYGPQCQHHNPCEPVNPCHHIGKCLNHSDGSYTCDCLHGFYGQNCSRIDPCAAVSSNPCHNGGSCVRRPASPQSHVRQESGEYTCLCPFGFFGGTCERRDPCASSPCLHGSACANVTDTDFTCNCTEGYTGETCEVNIDECRSSPCLNGGACEDGVATFSCTCMAGYTGALCQTEIDECASTPCRRGRCVDLLADFACECPRGWGGKACEVDLDECASSPCLNGATCIDGVDAFVCACAPGYVGGACEVPESCPAHTTVLDTGEFHWPATRHGQTAALSCTYGLRGTIAATPPATRPATTAEPPPADASSGASHEASALMSSGEMSLEYEEDLDSSPTLLPHSDEFTTQAEWQGGRFRISRRTRDVAAHAGNFDFSRGPAFQKDNPGSRRRLVTSHLRGAVSRRTGRRLHRKRQQMQARQEEGALDDARQGPQEFQPLREELGLEGPQRPRGRPRMRGFRAQKQAPVAQPRIGEEAVGSPPRRGRQFVSPPGDLPRIGEAPDPARIGDAFAEQPRIGARMTQQSRGGTEVIEDYPRIGESASDHPRIGESASDRPRIGESASDHPRIGESAFDRPRIGESASDRPRIGESASDHPRIGESASDHPRIGESASDHPRIGESAFDRPRIGESASDRPRIGESLSEHPRIGESQSEPPRIGESQPEPPRIGESASEPLSPGERASQRQRLAGGTRELPRIGETLSGQSEERIPRRQSLGEELPGGSEPGAELDVEPQAVRSKDGPPPGASSPEGTAALEQRQARASSASVGSPRAIPVFGSEIMKVQKADKHDPTTPTTPPTVGSARSHVRTGAVRACVLLPNGTVAWQEPDTEMCRGKEAQAAENAALSIATLTASPASVSPAMFTRAANELAKLVGHALHDRAVAKNMVSAISNMMEVNDSVVAEGDKTSNITQQLVSTINSFTESVPLELGEKVEFRSNNLVVEARMLKTGASDAVLFQPQLQETSASRRKREVNSSETSQAKESYLKLPPAVLSMATGESVRLEFVSFGNDKFFRGSRPLGMPVITARITNTTVKNLSEPVTYTIAEANTNANESLFRPSCVFWDDAAQDWSSAGMETQTVGGVTTCHASHLTAFSVLLDPMPAALGIHEKILSIITYVGLALSTAGLAATVATYAIFRTLNRDRSGKIVMNLSLALLLLNCVFFITTQVKPTSIACTALGAALHYLVLAAFAWMLVEAANMYQLLITVFASAETHFMAKRVVGAWGVPLLVVVTALAVDYRVYQDEERDICVINPRHNIIVYYAAYMGPICCVLAVNCVVFVMVTRVLCQRRPRSHKPHSSSVTPKKEGPVTLAQVRGAVTVVALLGVTWVAGAVSIGWARLTLQYIFCITTPLQGLIIFVVRVAQHPEARAAWIALLTTGTLRRRPPTTHTHSTHSSAHTHSTTSTPPRNHHSSARTVSTRASPLNSVKKSSSAARNGSTRHARGASKNGSVYRCASGTTDSSSRNSGMGTLLSRIVSRLNSGGLEPHGSPRAEHGTVESSASTKTALQTMPTGCSQANLSPQLYESEAFFSQALLDESYYQHSTMNGHAQRPHSLVLLRTESHGGAAKGQPPVAPPPFAGSQIPALLSPNQQLQTLLNAGVPPAMIPRRSLGSLMLLGEGKEGDDSSWHFVRPPPDGRSDPMDNDLPYDERNGGAPHAPTAFSRTAVVETTRRRMTTTTAAATESGCVVLAGQRVATRASPIIMADEGKEASPFTALIRANSEMQMGSPAVDTATLRRTASVYMLGEWEDPRSSQA
ncbi:uncharacterized protein LOC125028902 [Penaeus chinensis]|uniref:uncharacterized protein LOC125028902 n=1 Tax=Penaeus chinensis TaxID=139456 RepID=UPI001FB5C2F1|nr:uncharacterized protein LOC125028902 [Penaeus chinensis]